MPVLTDMTTSELVVPMTPPTVHRMVDFRGEGRWAAIPFGVEFSSALDALMAIRAEEQRQWSFPVRIEIQWRNVPRDFKPPTTGTALS